MTLAELAPALVAAVLVLWALGAHNRLVRLRNAIRTAWAQVDEPLRRRHDALRATAVGADTAAFVRADGVLASSIVRLLALLDQRPDVRARNDVAAWLRELHDGDLRLAFARQAFNDVVDAYNAALAQVPTRLLRPLFGFCVAQRL